MEQPARKQVKQGNPFVVRGLLATAGSGTGGTRIGGGTGGMMKIGGADKVLAGVF